MAGSDLATYPVHLGAAGTAIPQPAFPHDAGAMQWYADYAARHAADGDQGRLMSVFTFTESWPGWEMHPAGAEVVLCLEGAMTLIQELDGQEARTRLTAGHYAINPPGVWHTADVDSRACALFVTPGAGTQHRPR